MVTVSQLKTLPHQEKPWYNSTQKIYLRRDVQRLARERYGTFEKMLVAKSKAGRKKPAFLSSSKFIDKVYCDAHWGDGDPCTCGQHEGYVEPGGDGWCAGCGMYHDDY